jgi:hypothetical protein
MSVVYRAAALKCKENEKEELYQLIGIVNETSPFSAMGLFEVNKKTLTSIFGTILTYLIITIQFTMGSTK